MAGNKAMSQAHKQVQAKHRVQKLPQRESGCFRCLIPKNICTKQQENNKLVEDECFMGRFLPDMIAILFHFREVVEGLVAGVPANETCLPRFVNRIMAPCGLFTLKTVRLVESLGRLDVVKLVEELEVESDTDTESDAGEAGVGEGGRWAEQGVRGGSEDGIDLTVPSPEGGWSAGVMDVDVWSRAVDGRGCKRRASTRLSETFEEEKGFLWWKKVEEVVTLPKAKYDPLFLFLFALCLSCRHVCDS